MDTPVRLVFAGTVRDGFDRASVQQKLGAWLKLDGPRLEKLFSGRSVVIKRGLPAEQAAAWVKRFAALGAELKVEPDTPLPASVRPTPVPSAVPAAPAESALSLVSSEPPARPAQAEPPMRLAPDPAALDEVTCPTCGERQPRRILCRQCATDIPRALAAQEERRAAERAERVAAARARRGLKPLPDPAAERFQTEDEVPLLGRSFDGRLGRMSYLAGNLAAWAGMGLSFFLLLKWPGWTTGALMLGVVIWVMFFSWRLTTLRMHDFNRSGWWALLFGLPVIGPILSIVIMLVPGDEHPNDYGEPQRERHAGLAIAAVVVLGLSISLSLHAAKRWAERMSDAEEAAQAEQASRPKITLESVLGSPEAAQAFNRQYVTGRGHRAFARSPSGAAWGLRTDAASPDEAATDALRQCNGRRPEGGVACQLVHLDDAWVLPEN